MSFKSLVNYVHASWKAWNAPLPHDEEYRVWAEDACNFGCELFGPPTDPDWPYALINGTDGPSNCGRGMGRYNIRLSPRNDTPERRCQTIGHEIYHRLTLTRQGLRREVWVDEMMAFLFSEWFLERQKFPYHLGRVRERYLKSRGAVDMDLLRGFQRTDKYVRAFREMPAYPADFVTGVARVGLALNHLVGREAMCRVVEAEYWESWMDTLPRTIVYPVKSILGMSTEGASLSRNTAVHRGYGFALYAVGRHEEAIEQYREALGFKPDDKEAHYQIGFSLRAVGRTDEARRAWEDAACYDPTNANPAQSVASVYYGQKNYDRAIKWFAEAARRDPTRACAFYFWGKCCLAIGDPDGARRAWGRVAEIGDDAHAEEVRRFLDGESAIGG